MVSLNQAALTAGVDAANGRAVVIIDGDLQDPPEVIPEMVARWREGAEVVYGQREEREGETWLVDLEPDAAAEAVWSELIDQGWKITEIRGEGRGLESLYLSLTDASERKAA